MTEENQGANGKFLLWGSGIDYEVDFWRNWFVTRGGQWPTDFVRRLDLQTEIEPSFIDLITTAEPGAAKILDVGSGPLTVLGKLHRGVRLDITAVDPLADFYAGIASDCGVKVPCPVVKGFAEDLSSFFAQDSFDLVHCQNALDHSFEPVRAIFQMLKIAKPDGVVLLRHIPNEAENEDYSGFHQWNFDVQDGRFVVWNRSQRFNVNEMVESFSEITVAKSGGVSVIIRKRAAVPDLPYVDDRARVRELLNAVMDLSHRLAKAKKT